MSGPSYHAWTHLPKAQGGTDPIGPMGWVGDCAIAFDSVTGSGTATVSNNTLTNINFDQYFLSTGTAAFAEDQGAGTTRPFKAILDGWYLAYINFQWTQSGITDVRTYSFYSNIFPDNCSSQNVVESASSPFINSAFNGTYGPLYIRAAELGSGWFRTRVQHNAGVDRDVSSVLMTVLYLGPDLDPTSFPPF